MRHPALRLHTFSCRSSISFCIAGAPSAGCQEEELGPHVLPRISTPLTVQFKEPSSAASCVSYFYEIRLGGSMPP